MWKRREKAACGTTIKDQATLSIPTGPILFIFEFFECRSVEKEKNDCGANLMVRSEWHWPGCTDKKIAKCKKFILRNCHSTCFSHNFHKRSRIWTFQDALKRSWGDLSNWGEICAWIGSYEMWNVQNTLTSIWVVENYQKSGENPKQWEIANSALCVCVCYELNDANIWNSRDREMVINGTSTGVR